MKKRIGLSIILSIISYLIFIMLNFVPYPLFQVSVNYYDKADQVQIFWRETDNEFIESESMKSPTKNNITIKKIWKQDDFVRIDLGSAMQRVKVGDVKLGNFFLKVELTDIVETSELKILSSENGQFEIENTGSDPFLVFQTDGAYEKFEASITKIMSFVYIVCALLIGIIVFWQYEHFKILLFWALDIIISFRLIIELAFSDFKTRYAASYLGMIWAFVQPIVSVAIYVIVFGYGFKATPVKDFPFVLWLVSGIIPWFYFSDALMSSTTSLIEYSYLVKKIVFKVKILPLIKIIASLIIHVFFVAITTILFVANGITPNLYFIQIIYYIFCLTMLILGISYITAALNVFVPDLSHIVNIFLQFGMWMTPIMWSPDLFGEAGYRVVQVVPFYYIVEGYRDCFYNNVYFWEKPGLTLYFWLVTIILLVVGMYTFRKLEDHFADVL